MWVFIGGIVTGVLICVGMEILGKVVLRGAEVPMGGKEYDDSPHE